MKKLNMTAMGSLLPLGFSDMPCFAIVAIARELPASMTGRDIHTTMVLDSRLLLSRRSKSYR